MTEQFVGEIRVLACNFPPTGWAFCDGQLLPISQNTALFSLLGTTYGGDGRSTFALPNIQGQVLMHPGQGPGLSLHDLGETGGSETVTLLASEIPMHTHEVKVSESRASTRQAAERASLAVSAPGDRYAPGPPRSGTDGVMEATALTPAGGGLPHNNLMPYLTLNYCIALQGIFPARP